MYIPMKGTGRDGVWITTNNTWEYGTCLMEFKTGLSRTRTIPTLGPSTMI